MRYIIYILTLFLSTTAIAQDSYTPQGDLSLTVIVENIKHDKGKIFIALYDKKEDWLHNEMNGAIVPISDGKASAILEGLAKGSYGISIFHDENDNGEMDKNWMHIPTEPYACSRNARGTFGPPKWSDAVFEVSEDGQEIVIKM